MKRQILLLALTALQLYGAAGSRSDFRLITAARSGNLAETQKLLTSGIDAQQVTTPKTNDRQLHTGGETALHVALAELRRPSQAGYRSASGAPTNNNFEKIAEALINSNRFNLNQKNYASATPLHMLAGFIHDSAHESSKAGCLRGSDINETPRPDLARVAQLLIVNGANVNAQDMNGNAPLHWAAIHGFQDLIRTLIAHRAAVNIKNTQGQTPLMKAAQKGYLGIMQDLINANADVNIQDDTKGRTALHWVQRMREGAFAKHGDQMTKTRALDAMRMLLNAGADPTIKDKVTTDNPIARSAIDWAIERSPWGKMEKQQEIGLLLDPRYVEIRFKNGEPQAPTSPAASSSGSPAPSASSYAAPSQQETPEQEASATEDPATPASSSGSPAPSTSLYTAPSQQQETPEEREERELQEALRLSATEAALAAPASSSDSLRGWWQSLSDREKQIYVRRAIEKTNVMQDLHNIDTFYGGDAAFESIRDADQAGDALAKKYRELTGV